MQRENSWFHATHCKFAFEKRSLVLVCLGIYWIFRGTWQVFYFVGAGAESLVSSDYALDVVDLERAQQEDNSRK